MDTKMFIFFVLFMFLSHDQILHDQHIIFAKGDMDLIQKTCNKTKYHDLCVSSLKSNATNPNIDTKGLALIMIGVGIANATSTSTYLSSQLLSTSNDAILRKVLKECSIKYGFASDALQASLQDLEMESFDYAYMHVLGASDYPNSCHNGFRRFTGLVYPQELQQREIGLKQICDVVLGIIDMIDW